MPLAALGVIGAVGSIAGAAIGAGAAGDAASTQANAAIQAAKIQANSAAQALDFQKQQWGTSQAELAPWLSQGTAGLANLSYMLGLPVNGTYSIPGQSFAGAAVPSTVAGAGRVFDPATGGLVKGGATTFTGGAPGGTSSTGTLASLINPSLGAPGSLLQPFGEQFQAPTGATEVNDPGYKFRLQQGLDSMTNSAAARGGLLSGGTAKGMEQFSQDYASNEYGNVYNRAMQEYLNRFNIFNTNQTNTYNRLAAMAGIGQQAATNLGTMGQGVAGNVSNLLLNSGNAQAQGINNAAAATASGYVGGANAWTGALGGMSNNLMNLYLMNKFLNPSAMPSLGSTYGADIGSIPQLYP